MLEQAKVTTKLTLHEPPWWPMIVYFHRFKYNECKKLLPFSQSKSKKKLCCGKSHSSIWYIWLSVVDICCTVVWLSCCKIFISLLFGSQGDNTPPHLSSATSLFLCLIYDWKVNNKSIHPKIVWTMMPLLHPSHLTYLPAHILGQCFLPTSWISLDTAPALCERLVRR